MSVGPIATHQVVEKTIACLREFTAYCFGEHMAHSTTIIRANTLL